jgi:hypothetical protein
MAGGVETLKAADLSSFGFDFLRVGSTGRSHYPRLKPHLQESGWRKALSSVRSPGYYGIFHNQWQKRLVLGIFTSLGFAPVSPLFYWSSACVNASTTSSSVELLGKRRFAPKSVGRRIRPGVEAAHYNRFTLGIDAEETVDNASITRATYVNRCAHLSREFHHV